MLTGQRTINGTKAKKVIDKGNSIIIDIRDPVSYRNGSLPNAVNLSLRKISSLIKIPKTTSLIFFGVSNEDDDLRAAVNYAEQMGFKNVYSLGAIDNWGK